MRILVVGAGGIGGYFGARLAEAGEDGLSDHETARLTGWPMSSVCSIRNGTTRAGLVEPGERVDMSPYGCRVTTWRRR